MGNADDGFMLPTIPASYSPAIQTIERLLTQAGQLLHSYASHLQRSRAQTPQDQDEPFSVQNRLLGLAKDMRKFDTDVNDLRGYLCSAEPLTPDIERASLWLTAIFRGIRLAVGDADQLVAPNSSLQAEGVRFLTETYPQGRSVIRAAELTRDKEDRLQIWLSPSYPKLGEALKELFGVPWISGHPNEMMTSEDLINLYDLMVASEKIGKQILGTGEETPIPSPHARGELKNFIEEALPNAIRALQKYGVQKPNILAFLTFVAQSIPGADVVIREIPRTFENLHQRGWTGPRIIDIYYRLYQGTNSERLVFIFLHLTEAITSLQQATQDHNLVERALLQLLDPLLNFQVHCRQGDIVGEIFVCIGESLREMHEIQPLNDRQQLGRVVSLLRRLSDSHSVSDKAEVLVALKVLSRPS